ncbi:MAG: hypothetical protein K6C95_02245 [Lachnospiraceae bacterium]|nr:hypothetical protein [Lachnospiraceae bacterium]
MKIEGSYVQMASTSYYSRYLADGGRVSSEAKGTEQSFTESFGKSADMFANYTKSGDLTEGAEKTSEVGRNGGISQISMLRDLILARLLMRLQSSGIVYGLSQSLGGPSLTMINRSESEEVSFSAAGCAKTEDGRTIEFDLGIVMSSTFVAATRMSIPSLGASLMDPLVINVGSAVTEVSDQTFRFDLDADGEEEDVTALKRGSGFLALDKSGDGIINDGNELFGAKSGDGFGDLRQYDLDGNGWIDENDEVFSKLRVWYKNGDGDEELVDLKEVDIGAIFLGEQQTDMTMRGSDMRVGGMMRSTGFFLRESGGMGTVQHVDLAVRREGETSADAGAYEEALSATGGENFVSGYGRGDRAVAPDILVVETGRSEKTEDADKSENTVNDESAEIRRRRKAAAEERQRVREDTKKRRAERNRLNEEYAEKVRARRKDMEERLEELFRERSEERKDLEKIV